MSLNKPFSFGQTSTTSGSLFGSPASTLTQQPQTQSTNLFGSNTGGGFGTTSKPATQTTLTFNSSGGFGFAKPTTTASPFGQTTSATATTAPSTTTTQTSFGFNKPATTGSSFNFGQTTQTATTQGSTGFGGFGSTASTTTAPSTGFGSPLFGQGTQQQQQQQQQQQTSIFSGTTGAQPLGASFLSSTTTTGQPSGGFGLNISTIGQNQTLLNQPQANTTFQQVSEQDLFLNALVNPQVFNDERDLILSKWNQLQAFYGFGKIFYQNSGIDVNKDSRLTRFKTIGYSCKPSYKNEDGMICLVINQKEEIVRQNQKTIIECLTKIFDSDVTLIINIESIKPADAKTEVIFYVNKRVSQLSEQANRVPSSLVYNHLNKQETAPISLSSLNPKKTIKQQLESINVVEFYPLVGQTDEEIKNYLDIPPIGISPILWEQAKKNNPNPKNLLPVPITGFQEINKRFKLQNQENESHKASLIVVNNSIESLNSRNKLIKSKIEQFKARNEDLEQRILKVMINYEIRRKMGIPLQDNEKYLLSILDSFQMELNSPINKEIQRQKLNEFKETIKTYESSTRKPYGKTNSNISFGTELMDVNSLNEVQKTLREQHKAFKSLIEIINQDVKDLNNIKKDTSIVDKDDKMNNQENDEKNKNPTTSSDIKTIINIKKEVTDQDDVIQIKSKNAVEKEKCPICLHKFSFKSKSYSSTCFHSFCFECLLEWTKVRYNCPLCKQAFDRIIYDVKSTIEYKEYFLQPKESDTMTQPLEIIAYLPPSTSQNSHTLFLNQNNSTVSRASWIVNQQSAPIEFRMLVYKKGWYVNPNQIQLDIKITNIELEFNDDEEESSSEKSESKKSKNEKTQSVVEDVGLTISCINYKYPMRFRDTTPKWYKNNPACTYRLNHFLYRELKALAALQPTNTTDRLNSLVRSHLTQRISKLLKEVHIESDEFLKEVENYLRPIRYAKHFVHELNAFALSTCHDLLDYDSKCVYYESLNATKFPNKVNNNNIFPFNSLPVNISKYRLLKPPNTQIITQPLPRPPRPITPIPRVTPPPRSHTEPVVVYGENQPTGSQSDSEFSSYCEELTPSPKPIPECIVLTSSSCSSLSSSRSRSRTRSASSSRTRPRSSKSKNKKKDKSTASTSRDRSRSHSQNTSRSRKHHKKPKKRAHSKKKIKEKSSSKKSKKEKRSSNKRRSRPRSSNSSKGRSESRNRSR